MSKIENVISPVPEGAARFYDLAMVPRFGAAGNLAQASTSRGGVQQNIVGSATNWGLASSDNGTLVSYGGTVAYRVRGAIAHDVRVPQVVIRPTAITKWRIGLWICEIVVTWPSNTAGIDNGFLVNFNNNIGNIRVVDNAQQGWEVWNDAGQMKMSVRGPTGLVTTNLAYSVLAWTKIRVEVRHATRDADGSIQFFFNDQTTPDFTQSTAAANYPQQGANEAALMIFSVGCHSNVDYFYFKDWEVWGGPDTTIGM